MTDIIERLREYGGQSRAWRGELMIEAANEIEWLRVDKDMIRRSYDRALQDIIRLQKALEKAEMTLDGHR